MWLSHIDISAKNLVLLNLLARSIPGKSAAASYLHEVPGIERASGFMRYVLSPLSALRRLYPCPLNNTYSLWVFFFFKWLDGGVGFS